MGWSGDNVIADIGSLRHVSAVTRRTNISCAIAALLLSGCSPFAASTECKGLSGSKAIDLAREAKHGMLNRSIKSERERYASDAAEVADDNTGYIAKVIFTGTDGSQLIGLIDEDCYVGWTYSGR